MAAYKPNGRLWFVRKLLRPIPLTCVITAYGVAHHYHFKKRVVEDLKEAPHWEVVCYCSLPLRITSRVIGWASSKELPVSWRTSIYSKFASHFGVDLEEAVSQDLTSYPSFCDFFCRALRDGVRPVSWNASVVSPADGRVLTVGKVTSSRVEQVKGVTYSLEAFLGPPVWNESEDKSLQEDHRSLKDPTFINSLLENKENVLYQCVVYLAPGDYHRFHSPVDWSVKFRRHFQGELLSVNPRIADWIPDLFTLNERVVYVGHWKHGFFSYTAVGATNVGSIHVYFDESLKTNERKWRGKVKHKDLFFTNCEDEEGIRMKKGDLFGEFRMGSTVVLLFEAPKNFKFHVTEGAVTKVGEPVSDSDQ